MRGLVTGIAGALYISSPWLSVEKGTEPVEATRYHNLLEDIREIEGTTAKPTQALSLVDYRIDP